MERYPEKSWRPGDHWRPGFNWRRPETICFLVGGLLLAAWALPTVYGFAMARVAVAEFRAQGGSNRLWDRARVLAYQHTLEARFDAPEAILRVPRVGLEAPLLEGTSEPVLNRGVGHIAGTALPGQTGNLAIAGHRDGFFRVLKDVVPGDAIELERARPVGASMRPNLSVDRYIVRSTEVVSPSDVAVLRPTNDATLTLITCYPFYFVGRAPQRFVVHAALVPPSNISAKAAAGPLGGRLTP